MFLINKQIFFKKEEKNMTKGLKMIITFYFIKGLFEMFF